MESEAVSRDLSRWERVDVAEVGADVEAAKGKHKDEICGGTPSAASRSRKKENKRPLGGRKWL